MPPDKSWIYDPLRNPRHNWPSHHQFEFNLVKWCLAISEVELTYDDTQNVMIIDGHTPPCYFADGSCGPTTKIPYTLVWFSNDFCLIFTLQQIEPDSFVHSSTPKKSATKKFLKYFLMLKLFVVNLNLYILLSTLIFLLLIQKDLVCIQDNRTLVL